MANKDVAPDYEYTLFPIILNGSNIVNDNTFNNKYRYTFPQGSVRFEKSSVALETASLYYSWFNISSDYGNTTYQFTFTSGAGTSTYTVTMPDGNYSVTELNTYLQSFCITNGLYLVDGSGDYVYYLEILENPTYYAIQLNVYPFPTALPVGYTNPAALTFPAVASTPQFIIPSGGFGTVIGFSAGTYPSVIGTTAESFLSDVTPQVSPVASVILTCSLLNNRYSNPSTVLYSFNPAGVAFGSIISVQPRQYAFVDIQDGLYTTFDIQFLDQDFQPISITDTNLVVQFLIRARKNRF